MENRLKHSHPSPPEAPLEKLEIANKPVSKNITFSVVSLVCGLALGLLQGKRFPEIPSKYPLIPPVTPFPCGMSPC